MELTLATGSGKLKPRAFMPALLGALPLLFTVWMVSEETSLSSMAMSVVLRMLRFSAALFCVLFLGNLVFGRFLSMSATSESTGISSTGTTFDTTSARPIDTTTANATRTTASLSFCFFLFSIINMLWLLLLFLMAKI